MRREGRLPDRSPEDTTPDLVEAFTAAYIEHHGPVLRVVKRFMPDADAETVTHDVFLSYWSHPERWQPERGTLRTFLITAARSRSVDLWRSDAARRRREDLPDPSLPLRAEIDFDGSHGELRHAVAVLPELERISIERVFYGNRTYTEAATSLGWPEGTLKTRVRRALLRLRTHLTEAPDDPSAPPSLSDVVGSG